MKITTDGLVIWESKTGEADRVITLLTENGIITAYAKNSLRPKNKLTSPTSMLCFSNFELYSGTNMYTVDDAQIKHRFIKLSTDVNGYSLAAYFCELLKLLAPIEDAAEDFLSLMMNSLYLINEGKKPLFLIKSVFEMRIMCLAGYMPDIAECAECGESNSAGGFFDVTNGVFYCESCVKKSGRAVNIGAAAVSAIRHIISAESGKIFSFDIGVASLSALKDVSEAYVCTHIDHRLPTLEFYNSLTT